MMSNEVQYLAGVCVLCVNSVEQPVLVYSNRHKSDFIVLLRALRYQLKTSLFDKFQQNNLVKYAAAYIRSYD